MKDQIKLLDHDGGYGWISILLHWLTAAAILWLLFEGDSIAINGIGARNLHTTIGVCAWGILAARVFWRLQQGHPPRHEGMGRISFFLGITVHFALLLAIALMLISGPLAGWASGLGFDVFGMHIAGAETVSLETYGVARGMHVAGAATLAIGTTLHVAGVLKHVFIDNDRTLDRMLIPPPPPPRSPKHPL